MKILTDPHPMLHTVCRPDWVMDRETIQSMFSLLMEHNALGLAAPQVGIDARVFVTQWGQVFVNPMIVDASDAIWSREGCLSIPGREYRIRRFTKIELKTGEKFTGIQAIVIQHELAHLDGRLISDPKHG